jgi:hypothetical protein
LDEVTLKYEKLKQEMGKLQTKFDIETDRLNVRVKELEEENAK